MKVLILASYAGSLVSFRGELIKSLVESGCDILLAAPSIGSCSFDKAPFSISDVSTFDVLIDRAGVNPFRDAAAFISIFFLMRKARPDVVLAYTVKPVVYGMMAARMAGVRKRYALITGLGYAFTDARKGLVPTLVKRLYRAALSFSTKVFYQNPDDELLFRQTGLLPAHIPSVIVNGSGIDVTQFQVALLPATPSFLLIARLLGDKGVREYIAAARRIKASYPGATFKLVGWIDENPDAIQQEELDAWVAEGVVEYLGKLTDVRPAIQASAVYVLPSYREGTPRTVLEAMAMGRAIVTTDAPGCRETVVDGENGFLVPVKDSDALAEAMLKFIEKPELIVAMGKRSREIAEEKYDVDKVNAVMLREMGL